MKRRVTSLDIAKRAGISRPMVSYVINGRTDLSIAPETRERILRAARELNYVPNAAARGLATGRTQIIGVWIGDPTDPHYAGLLGDLLLEAREQGYRLLVISEDDSASSLLSEGRLDGLLAIGASEGLAEEFSKEALADTLHVVVCGYGEQSPFKTVAHRVEWDDNQGARQMVQHLVSLGHRNIAMFAGIAGAENPKVKGYLDAMEEAGLAPVLLQCGTEKDPYLAGRRMLKEVRRGHPEVTALFCRNDMFALGALSLAAEMGLQIPGELSVAGYTNVPMAAYSVPSLTTAATPIREAGRKAMKMLLAMLAGKKVRNQCITMPVGLVERSSTGSLPAPAGTAKAASRTEKVKQSHNGVMRGRDIE